MNDQLTSACRQAAARTLDWIGSRVGADGSLGDTC